MHVIDLGISRVPQESCNTCGPAVVRMMRGAGAPSESEIAAWIRKFMEDNENDCFFTSPEALAAALKHFLKTPFRADRRQDGMNRLIVSVIKDRKTPVPVLVKECAHWLIVSGFIYEMVQGEIAVSAFLIDDPINPCLNCNSNAVAPICKGGKHAGRFKDEIPAKAWRKRWATPCDCDQEQELVCVVPADAVDGPLGVRDLEPDDSGPLDVAGKVVSIEDLDVCLERAKRVYGLEAEGTFEKSLRGASVQAARPVSSEEGDYYLAEVGQPGSVSALIIFDRVNGGLISAKAFEEPVERFLPEDERLIWNPSREFQSPYFPFFLSGEGEDSVFVGTNGVTYRRLHPPRA